MDHHLPKYDKDEFNHSDDVIIIPSIVTPTIEHLSLALDAIGRAMNPGTCGLGTARGIKAHQNSMSSVLHSWCTIESAVNLVLYHRFHNEDAHFHIPANEYKHSDKEVKKKLNKSYPLISKLEYLTDVSPSTCSCTTVADLHGKIRNFEKLRNAIAHGYSFRRNTLAEKDADSEQVSYDGETGRKVVTAIYTSRDGELLNPDGSNKDWLADYKELALLHDPSELCRHDAMKCLAVTIKIVCWLDSHFGVGTSAAWSMVGTNYNFYTRCNPNGKIQGRTSCVGANQLWDAINKADVKAKKFPTTKHKKRKALKVRHQKSKRKK